MADEIGAMRERLTVQRSDPPALTLSSLTRSGAAATAVTYAAHGYTTNDYVTIADATPTGFNGRYKVTVVDALTFTYTVGGAPVSPATFAGTATYVSDAQGGRHVGWRTLASIWGELLPLSSNERLQLKAIQSNVSVRFRVRSRSDFAETQRVLWTPRWPPGQAQQTYEINGILPVEDGRVFTFLECSLAP